MDIKKRRGNILIYKGKEGEWMYRKGNGNGCKGKEGGMDINKRIDWI